MFDLISKRFINWALEKRNSLALNKKIKKIYGLCKSQSKTLNLDRKVLLEYKQKWGQLNTRINHKWLEVYSHISGIKSIDYVPENIYYNIVEPCLNNRSLTAAFSDKNFYRSRYNIRDLFPKTVIQNINGVFYDSGYHPLPEDDKVIFKELTQSNKIIIKPSIDSGGGRNVRLFARDGSDVFADSEGRPLTLQRLKNEYAVNFLIQEYIRQHDFFYRFNQTSVNTVRIFSYRSTSNEEIVPLHAVLRIGRAGKVVDNQASGGIACGIWPDGTLNSFAVDKWGLVYESSNSVSFSRVGNVLGFEKMLEWVKQIAPLLYYSRVNGFDFCVDQNENIRLLEINSKNIEINFMQMGTGPLFKNYTDEVIYFCRSHPKSVCLDFTIE